MHALTAQVQHPCVQKTQVHSVDSGSAAAEMTNLVHNLFCLCAVEPEASSDSSPSTDPDPSSDSSPSTDPSPDGPQSCGYGVYRLQIYQMNVANLVGSKNAALNRTSQTSVFPLRASYWVYGNVVCSYAWSLRDVGMQSQLGYTARHLGSRVSKCRQFGPQVVQVHYCVFRRNM